MDIRSLCLQKLYGYFFVLAIFGNKKRLVPGEDDDKLLECLENSDLEFSDDENDSDDDVNGLDEQVVNLSEEELDQFERDLEDQVGEEVVLEDDDSDNELLSDLKKRLEEQKSASCGKRTTWIKMGLFFPQKVNYTGMADTEHDREFWKTKDYVNMYFDDCDFENICNCTNVKYLMDKGKSMNLTVAEVRKFFGISVLMSCLKYPQIKMYWAKMTKVSAITNSMTRDRYFQIRSNLKVVIDTDVSEEDRKADKLFKIRPLHERIKNGCRSLPRYNEVAVDEQMIPFSGVCKIKQFVRGKPNPEGLKNFVCATPKGLILDFEIYQGKNTFLQADVAEMGVGPSAVVRLSTTLLEGTHIYVDRYFTTVRLLEYLLNKNILVTGTINKNRVPKSVNLTSDKVMARLGRGSSEQDVRSDGNMNIVQWYDMKSVILASTSLQIEPQNECKRWSKKDSRFIQVPRPHIVKKYNDSMGGIDLIDRMISYYRMGARSKKWTVKTIFHLFDVGIANSWILYRDDRKQLGDSNKTIMKFLDFKISVAELLLKDTNTETDTELTNISSLVTRNSSSTRLSSLSSTPTGTKRKIQHIPAMASHLKNSVRCKNVGCKLKTKVYCESCSFFLCFTGTNNCFKSFHLR